MQGGAILTATFLLAACGQKEIGYKADVQPIIKQYCMECHVAGGKGHEKSGRLMTSYENLMKGTKFGSLIKPGDSLTSAMIMLVEGRADNFHCGHFSFQAIRAPCLMKNHGRTGRRNRAGTML